ncbi:hypothetical protein VNI00_004108 [Paramarasmius palmivorus]|uniref:Uncharacterized protein n=1 Tax=Paramarasmius palmivorus TaxID=297713 RepID=A0AAW0DQU6_9AGAR
MVLMILLDVENQQKSDIQVAGPTIRLPEPSVYGRSTSSLPDYESSQAQYAASPAKSPRKRVDSRFWRATLFALGIYVALSIIIGVPVIVLKKVKHQKKPDPPSPWLGGDDDSSSQMPVSLKALAMNSSASCNRWDSTQEAGSYTATALQTFSPSGTFAIHSDNGHGIDHMPNFFGQLIVDVNEDPSVSSAVIHVFLNSSNNDNWLETNICFVDQGTRRGLSIFLPSNIQSSETLSLTIRLLFPISPTVLDIDSITTELPGFLQSFGDLGNKMFIKKMDVEGAGMNISCNTVSAAKATLKNSLAPISGVFNISEGLNIDTVSGPVVANITLVQQASSKGPTYFSIGTGNSIIDAQVILKAPPAGSVDHPTTFLGQVKGFSAPLRLSVLHDDSAPPAPIDLFVQNNQADTNVSVDSKFVGIFDARTKLAAVTIDGDSDSSSSDGSTRQFVYDNSAPNRKSGWVGTGIRPMRWDPKEQSRLLVESSLSPIFLGIGS